MSRETSRNLLAADPPASNFPKNKICEAVKPILDKPLVPRRYGLGSWRQRKDVPFLPQKSAERKPRKETCPTKFATKRAR